MFMKKYMLIVGGALVFLVFIIGILSVTFNYLELNREWALHEFEDDIKTGSEELKYYLEPLRSDLLRIEKYLANSNMKVGEELYGYLDFVMGHHPNAIPEILILDVNGKVVAGTNPASVQSSFQESKYFRNTQHIPNKVYLSEAIIVSDLFSRSEVALKVFMDPLDLGFILHTGVNSKGVFKGAVLFVLRAEPFFNRYSMALTKLTSGYGFILQEDGRILFHREVELRGKFISDLPESYGLTKVNDLLKNTEEKTLKYRATGQDLVVVSEVYLENQRWALGISTCRSKLAQKTLTTIYTLSGVLLLLGMIIFGLVFSLTRLGQTKAMVRESEKRLRLMVEQIGAVLWTTDTELHFTSSHGSGLEALNLRPDQIVGRTLYEYFQTDDPMFVPIASHRRALDGESVNYEQIWDDITFQTHVEPLRNTVGNIKGVIGISLDITERKQVEEHLRENEQNFRDLVENLLDGVAIVDENAYHIYVNPRFSEITGYSRDELLNMSGWDFTRPEDRAKLEQRMRDRIAGKAVQKSYERTIVRKDGTEVPVEMSTTVTIWRGKKRPMAIVHDITERKQAEEVLSESKLRLRHLSSRLISTQEDERKRISMELHDEMGQTLTAVSINLESIRKKLPPEHAAMVKDNLSETIFLVEQASDRIRDLSLDLRPSMLDDLGLLPTLRWHINSYEKRTETPVIFEAVNLGEKLTPEVEIVLYRVVQESLNNIAKHARAKKIKIRLEYKKKKIGVLIEDDGIGFHPDRVLSETPQGKGVGLLGMRERVIFLGGSFSIQSREGQGTSIFVELPLY